MDEKIKRYQRWLVDARDGGHPWADYDAGLFEAYDIALAVFEKLFMEESND